MISDILKRVEAMGVLPDSWIVTRSPGAEVLVDGQLLEPITAGDLRALVARVRECEAAAENKRRDDMLRVSCALLVSGLYETETTTGAIDDVIDDARTLINEIDRDAARDTEANEIEKTL